MLLNRKISVWYFINEIKSQLLLIAVFAVGVALLDKLPAFKEISMPLSAAALIGTLVSLMLAFRTAQSYERWWEARTVWGAIVNDSRTFIRQIIQFVPDKDEQVVKGFADRQIIMVHALGESLRRQKYSPNVQAYLNFNLIIATNIPNCLLDQHSVGIKQLAREGVITDIQQVQLNETLSRLCDSMGKCERIKNTVFPRSYSVLVHMLIYVFAAILPFGLDDTQLLVEIGLTILIPVLFIAIEKTAILMQDPFENKPVDTPMTAMAETIEINIREMCNDMNVPVKKENKLYYEM